MPRPRLRPTPRLRLTLMGEPVSEGKVVALRRTYNGEEAWFELLEELGHRGLRLGFIAAGVRASIAANLTAFVEDQKFLDRHQSEKSRNNYRRQLAELDVGQVRKAAASVAIGGQFNSGIAA